MKPFVCLCLCLISCLCRATHAQYEFAADFTVHDAQNRCQQLDIEQDTSFSHGHGRVAEGKYEILLDTSRHFLATPQLADFSLAFTSSMRAHYWRDANIRDLLGFKVFFRWNRTENRGDILEWTIDNDRFLRVTVNGKTVFSRQEPMDAVVRTNDVFCLTVKGDAGVLSFNGTDVRFPLETAGVAGFVALDSHRAHSELMKLTKLTLTSEAAPAKTHLKDYAFVLSQEQGFQEPLRFDVTLSRYATGETEISYKQGGTVAELGPRLKTGGTEWSRILERLTDPYLRIETEQGVFREIFLWNGMRQLADPSVIRGAKRVNAGWPASGRIVFRDFPTNFTIAAGYSQAVVSPWRFAANGPWEQIQDASGRILFEGGSVKGAGLAVRTTPKGCSAVLKRIPTDVPRYADVRRHTLEGGYFTASETVSYTLETCFRASRWNVSEVKLVPRFETVFGKPLADGAFDLSEPRVEPLEAGLVRVTQDVTLRRNPGCGVYHLMLTAPDGKTSKTVFEILSDDPNGPIPPLASGLPFLFSMPNECPNLEQSAFDPWNPFAGLSHYYSLTHLYPIVGESRQVWRVLPAFARSWWCWSWSRNTDDHDIYNDFNRNLIRHSGYFGGQDDRRHKQTGGSYDFASRWYDGEMIRWLAEFVRLHPGKFTRLNEARLEELLRRDGGVKFEDIKEIFDAGLWEEYLAYVWPRTDKSIQDYVDYVLGLNPKAGLATYGPFHVYVGRYKTAYTLRETGHVVEKDPRVRANGSFWVFEEYHHSCDYPLSRGSLFAATYDLLCGYGRKLYPEIYYAGWGRCDDGAVFQAHPCPNPPLADTHQRKVVYTYTYGTPRFKDGAYGYWRDWGFHARNPEREAMEQFVYAWGKMLANKPVASAKAAFLMTDPAAFVRHGDFLDDEYNPNWCWGVEPDVCNTAEEGLCYLHERAVIEGYTPPVVSLLQELDRLTPEMTDYVALPPIVKGTPPETIAAIRRAYDRGINLFCSEACEGLEDIFGVAPASVRPVRRIGEESFTHKLAKAGYRATDAAVTLWGAEQPADKADIPLVFRRTGKARTVFVALPPSCVRKNRLTNHFHRGTDSISREMAGEMRSIFTFLASRPSVKSERGGATAAYTEKGDLAVVITEESPIYNDTTVYPVSYRFTVRAPRIEAAEIEADVPYTVVSRGKDEITLRLSTPKDTAHLFVFKGVRQAKARRLLAIGDSITAGFKWQNFVGEEIGYAVRSHCKGGIQAVQMVDGDGSGSAPPAFDPNTFGVDHLYALDVSQVRDVDLIILMGFYNERQNKPGQANDLYPAQDTICGHVNYAVARIQSLLKEAHNESCPIVLVSPHCYGKCRWSENTGYDDAAPLIDAIRAVAAHRKLPFLDLYETSGIDRTNWNLYQADPTPYEATYLTPEGDCRDGKNHPFPTLASLPDPATCATRYATVVGQTGCFRSDGVRWTPNKAPCPWNADQLHLNTQGHRRIAGVITRWLRSLPGLLKGESPVDVFIGTAGVGHVSPAVSSSSILCLCRIDSSAGAM